VLELVAAQAEGLLRHDALSLMRRGFILMRADAQG
jgi:hypothetical protein